MEVRALKAALGRRMRIVEHSNPLQWLLERLPAAARNAVAGVALSPPGHSSASLSDTARTGASWECPDNFHNSVTLTGCQIRESAAASINVKGRRRNLGNSEGWCFITSVSACDPPRPELGAVAVL